MTRNRETLLMPASSEFRKDRPVPEIHHHLLRGDLGIDHALLSWRTVGMLAPHAGTELDIQTPVLSGLQSRCSSSAGRL